MKKILAILLALAIVLFSFASCKKDDEKPYYVDEEGQTQIAEKDENGKYFVTDDEGNKTYIDDKDVVDEKLDSDLQEFVDNAEKNPDKVFDNADKDDKLEMSDELVTDKVVVVEPDGGEANAQKRLQAYKKVIDTNKFTIQAMVKEVGGDDYEYPFFYVRNGNGAYIETAVPFDGGKVIKANMIIVGGKTYCEIPSLKCYMTVDDMSIEDLADGTFDGNSLATYKFVESGEVTLNGKKYSCDVYTVDTDTIKYYYDSNDNLVRIEKIGKRDSVITEIKSMTNSADSSKIKKPKGIDITALVG
ncbi:MAG: hypothetical protein IJB72_02015 [Clostridia bacterium]|nr:hypothetical protein [Clostridia bacterium]